MKHSPWTEGVYGLGRETADTAVSTHLQRGVHAGAAGLLTETFPLRRMIPHFLCEIEKKKSNFRNRIAGFTMCKCPEVTQFTQNGLCEVC